MCAADSAAPMTCLDSAVAPASIPAPASTDWQQLLPLRHALVGYARQRLPDPALAEDLVHDVFEIVMTRRAVFEGRSSLKSWLVGILKHKIVDVLRQRACSGWPDPDGDEDEPDAARQIACPWPGPDLQAEHRERLHRTLQRLEQLPGPLRSAIEQRCLHDDDADQVCHTLGITPSHLYVRLHRARRALLEL